MAGFDPSKDKVLKSWKCEDTGLVISINQYGDGEPKLQIGPRMIKTKSDTERVGKVGRLSIEDFMWFYDIIDEIKEEFSSVVEPSA